MAVVSVNQLSLFRRFIDLGNDRSSELSNGIREDMHAAAIENCPRCQARDRTSAPLTFKAFQFPDRAETKPVAVDQTTTEAPTEAPAQC